MLKIHYPTSYPSLNHAFRIAEFCGFPVCVIVSPDYVEAYEDYQLLKEHYSNVSFTSEFNGSIIVEFFRPNPEFTKNKQEDCVYTHGNSLPIVFNQVADTFIKTCIERLSLGIPSETWLRRLGQGIAQFYGYKEVRVEHAAEALQYTNPYRSQNETWVCAENALIRIGNGIQIDVLKPSLEDIDKAIAILKEIKTSRLLI